MSKQPWYWYVSGPNEIFIDCDRYEQSVKHIRRRLQGAQDSGILKIHRLENLESARKGHRHIIITVEQPLSPLEKAAWQILFHSDIYRTACNLMRWQRKMFAADILITRQRFYLAPFRMVCYCSKKHSAKMMEKCPAAIYLRGEERMLSFFGKPSDNPCNFL